MLSGKQGIARVRRILRQHSEYTDAFKFEHTKKMQELHQRENDYAKSYMKLGVPRLTSRRYARQNQLAGLKARYDPSMEEKISQLFLGRGSP